MALTTYSYIGACGWGRRSLAQLAVSRSEPTIEVHAAPILSGANTVRQAKAPAQDMRGVWNAEMGTLRGRLEGPRARGQLWQPSALGEM